MSLTPEQLAIRRNRISGSDVAAIAGKNPYKGPLEVYLEKKGLKEPEDLEGNMDVERGIFAEPMIIAWYQHRTKHVVRPCDTIVHPERDWMCATPDGAVHIDGVLSRALEAKAPRRDIHWGEPGTDDVPPWYNLQTQLEAAVLGVPTTDVAVFVHGELRVYHVPANAALFDALCDISARFIRDHLEADVPPPADASEKARKWLEQRYPRAAIDWMEPTDELVELARDYDLARAEKTAAEKRQDLYGNRLRQLIGDHQGFVTDGVKVTWKNNKDGAKLDHEALIAELNPPMELIQKHTRITTGARVLRVVVKE